MSNSNGANSLARSLNGIITYDDGSGTVIENGTIKTNNLALNTISAEYPTKTCEIWSNTTGSTYYSAYATGPIYFGLGSTSNINIGPIASISSAGNFNLATSSGLSGLINIGNASATASRIKLLSPIVECSVAPTIGSSVCNKTYVDTKNPALLAGTNTWTGVSNTFDNPIYASIESNDTINIGTLTTTNSINIGNASVGATQIRNSDGLVIGQNPSTYFSSTGAMSAPGLVLKNIVGSSRLDFHSNTLNNLNYDSRILCQGGSATGAGTGTMDIQSGVITLSGATSVVLESFTFISSSLQSTAIASTVDFFNNGNTTTLNIGNSATAVNIGGTKTNIAVNGFYNHEFNAGSGLCWHDFHSCSTTNTNNYDGKILCTGGTAGTVGKGAMQYSGASHNFSGGGISFDKGNLTGSFFIQTGKVSGIAQVAANSPSGAAIVVNFTTAFGTAPIVNVTAWSYLGTNASGLITTVYLTATNQFQFNVYNARSVNSGLWGYHWTAIGGY